MSKIEITRGIMQRVLLVSFWLIGVLVINNSVFANNLLFKENTIGVVRSGGSGFRCRSQNYGFSVWVGSSCKTPPVMLGIQILGEYTYPYHQFSITVTDPDGEVVPTDKYKRFLATKFGAYSVVVVDLDSGDSASCFGYVRPCKSKTQEEWANSKGALHSNRIFIGGSWSSLSQRSLIFEDIDCATRLLPATGKITSLPKGLGQVWVGDAWDGLQTCNLRSYSAEIKPNLDEIFDNPLVGEQIALSLNIWSDIGGGFVTLLGDPDPLGSLELCETVRVLRVSDKSIQHIHIPPSVINAIPYSWPYMRRDINGLMELADRALAGDKDLGGTNLADIHTALVNVNKGFGDGSYFVGCHSK